MRRKAVGTWYLIAKYQRHAEQYQRQADNAAKIALFENYVAKHGGADIHITPNEIDKLARIHASFRELPENPVEVREQLERAGFIDPCFIRCTASAVSKCKEKAPYLPRRYAPVAATAALMCGQTGAR